MAIISKDGFEFYEDINGNITFIFKGLNIQKEVDYVINNQIKSLAFNYFKSNAVKDLEFLKDLNFIEKVSLDDLNFSYESLYYLINLKELTIGVKNKKQHLDYSNFPKLEILSIDWYNDFPDLSKNENLKELSVWKFKPKSKSLAELSLPKNLEKLHITESNILSLEGILMENLKEFEGHYCNSLETVTGIKDFSNNLELLILDYCRKLTNYDELKFCKELKKIILGNSGDIPSLKWLNELEKVKHFSFWNTKLIDGDTSPCFGIEYVSFKNQKHYIHKEEEFSNVP